MRVKVLWIEYLVPILHYFSLFWYGRFHNLGFSYLWGQKHSTTWICILWYPFFTFFCHFFSRIRAGDKKGRKLSWLEMMVPNENLLSPAVLNRTETGREWKFRYPWTTIQIILIFLWNSFHSLFVTLCNIFMGAISATLMKSETYIEFILPKSIWRPLGVEASLLSGNNNERETKLINCWIDKRMVLSAT